MKMTKFSDWESRKFRANEEEKEAARAKVDSNAKLLAEIADLEGKRKGHLKNKQDFEARILEVDIKLLKLEVEKNNLNDTREQLVAAHEISKSSRKEGKTL
jgi:hypothetical protein